MPDQRPVSASDTASAIVGREAELAAIERWCSGERPALLELQGEAGIGKTALWREAVRRAGDGDALVLCCRPVEVERDVPYGALATLLEPLLVLVRGDVPLPRLRALEGALRLRDVPRSGLDPTAVALGAVSALRAASACCVVVVAVDDVHWLDASSRTVLTYALRSLRSGDDVRVVLAYRSTPGDDPLDLSGSDLASDSRALHPGPLSVGALHRVISARLGRPLSRPRLVRVHEASRGNPLHALALASVVAEASPGAVALTVGGSLADLLRARIGALARPTRDLLLRVAAAGEPQPGVLQRAFGTQDLPDRLREAIEHGVLVSSDGRLRFAHPLYAETVYGDADEHERRAVHLRLADLAISAEDRARHLALAGTGPDESVSAALELGAESACRRGARAAGAALYEQAAALTPAGSDETRDRRLLEAGRAHFQAGEHERARAVLEVVANGRSPLRFEALCRLGTVLDETVGGDAAFAAFESALETDDPGVASSAHRGLAQALVYVGRVDDALRHVDDAVAAAERVVDPVGLVYALAMQAFVRKVAGHPGWRQPLESGLALEAQVELPELDGSPSAFAADTCRLLLELDEARAAYEHLLEHSVGRGEAGTEVWCRFGLASVEIAAGRWDSASEHAAELADLAEQTALFRLPAARTTCHLAILRGDVDQARALLRVIATDAEPHGELHNLRCGLHLEGLLELSLGDARRAIEPLRRARLIAEDTAIGEPSLLAFMLDEVDALATAGDAGSGAAVLRAFEERCDSHSSPRIGPLVERAHGLVRAAEGDLTAAQAALEAAVASEQLIPLPLERARTRLALGRVLRRLQRRSAAHATLTEAATAFDELGARLWAERAREELCRIGGRAPSRDELTPTELRVAELASEGLTNREVAAALFVTSKTVESTLTRIYRKLDVRSRTELTRLLARTG